MNNVSLPSDYSSMPRRQLLNFLTGTAIATTASAVLYSTAKFLVPPRENNGDDSTIAKDRFGQPISASQILQEAEGTRALVAGLAGEPTYVTVRKNSQLDTIGIVDNCTHLGCTFPWNPHDNQFQCPCHGSRYAADSSVIKGPAPLPLKIVRVEVREDAILISAWTTNDPRTQEKPWWI